MKLITYKSKGIENLGMMVNGEIYKLQDIDLQLPNDMLTLLNGGEPSMQKVKDASQHIGKVKSVKDYRIIAPVPKPVSCRDGYAFQAACGGSKT